MNTGAGPGLLAPARGVMSTGSKLGRGRETACESDLEGVVSPVGAVAAGNPEPVPSVLSRFVTRHDPKGSVKPLSAVAWPADWPMLDRARPGGRLAGRGNEDWDPTAWVLGSAAADRA